MRKIKKMAAFLLTAAIGISSFQAIPAEAADYIWLNSKSATYSMDENGKWQLSSDEVFKYDKNGNQTTGTSNDYTDGKKSTSVSKFKYKKGKLASVTVTKDKKIVNKTVYTRNKKGLTTKIQLYNENNKIESTTTKKYNKKGKVTKEVTTRQDKSKTVTTYKYVYKKGKLSKSIQKDSDGTVFTTLFWANGNMKSCSYVTEGFKSYTEYDKKGFEKRNVFDGSFSREESTYKYKKGKLKETKIVTTFKDTKETETCLETYKEKYDKQGNIIEKIVYQNGKAKYKYVYSGYKKYKDNGSSYGSEALNEL